MARAAPVPPRELTIACVDIRGFLPRRACGDRIATVLSPPTYAARLDQLPMPTERRRPPDRGAVWLGLLILYVVWGSTYLGIAVAVETIPPFLMAATRFAIAAQC